MAADRLKKAYIPQHTYHGRVQRDMRIDNVRGVLIILVVIGHFLLPVSRDSSRLVTGLFYVIYSFHMPCFIMLSGFYAKGVVKNGQFKWGKVVQMLWLYLVYELVVFFTEGLDYGWLSHIPYFLAETGAPWYLMSLALYYMTIPLFYRLKGTGSAKLALALMFLLVPFLKYLLPTKSILSLDRTISFLPFFYLGYFSSQMTLDRYILSDYKKYVDIAAAFLVLLIFCGAKDLFMKYNLVVFGVDYIRYSEDMRSYLWLLNMIWYGVALTISLGLIGIMLNRRMFLLTDLGKNTLSIYFLHRPIRDVLEAFGFFALVDPYNRLHVLGLVIFSGVLTIFLGAGIFSGWFRSLRTVFDPLLEKHNAL